MFFIAMLAGAVLLSSCGSAVASQTSPSLEVAMSGDDCEMLQVDLGDSVAVLKTAGVQDFNVPPGKSVVVRCFRSNGPDSSVYLKPGDSPQKPVRVYDSAPTATGLYVEPEFYEAIARHSSLPARPTTQ